MKVIVRSTTGAIGGHTVSALVRAAQTVSIFDWQALTEAFVGLYWLLSRSVPKSGRKSSSRKLECHRSHALMAKKKNQYSSHEHSNVERICSVASTTGKDVLSSPIYAVISHPKTMLL